HRIISEGTANMTHRLYTRRAPVVAALALILATLALLGCTPAAPTAEATEAAQPTDAPTSPDSGSGLTPEPGEGNIESSTNTFTITNNTGVELCRAYINLAGTPRLPDQLRDDQSVPSGTSFTFENVRANKYDILLSDCEGQPVISAHGVYLGMEPIEWTLGQLTDLTFENDSAGDVCALHISPVFATSWGPNLLDDGTTVEAGASMVIEQYPAGLYDMLIRPCDAEGGVEVFGFEIAEGAAYTFEGS